MNNMNFERNPRDVMNNDLVTDSIISKNKNLVSELDPREDSIIAGSKLTDRSNSKEPTHDFNQNTNN